MRIILAVDILNGKVVKAFAGLRMNYKPLLIDNKDYSDAIGLIKEVKKKILLKEVYIADLNSINKNGTNKEYIERILQKFPDLVFLIDAGFDYPISVYKYHKEKNNKNLSNYNIVLGTETLRNFKLLSFQQSKKILLSIDFNGEQDGWIKKIRKESVNCNIILMFLNKVGGRGLDLALIKKMIGLLYPKRVTVGGGVNTDGQLSQLHRIGVESVLSSTLIHRKISRDDNFSP
tara:strand:- start:191 stop:886 length:696 start_codon:yes stop_codon:yes gene_type:complete